MINIYIFLLGILNLSFNIRNFYNNDYYWHISVGKWILDNKKIPTHDIFSWFGKTNSLKFIAHEWLSDIIMFIIGKKGIIILLAIITTIFFYFIVKYLKFNKNNILNNSIKLFFLLLIIKILVSIEARPLMFSLLLFNLFLIFLNKLIMEENKKYLYIIIIIQLFWVNLHGGSSVLIPLISFIIYAYYLIEKLLSVKKSTLNNNQANNIILLLIFSILISFINPYTYKIVIYPFINMLDTNMINSIDEWHSIDFHGIIGIYYFIILFLPFISILSNKSKKNPTDIIILFLFLFMSLRSIRFIQFYIFIGAYIIGKYLNINLKTKRKIIINKYLVTAVSIFSIISISIIQIKTNIKNINKNYSYSNTAINKIIEYNPKRMFNDYNNGGYLTYKLYNSNIDIFINSIFDIYSNNIIIDYNKMLKGIDVNQITKMYDFDLIIVPPNSTINIYIDKNYYKLYYNDKTANIYIKKEK